jgi:hypothetical protein
MANIMTPEFRVSYPKVFKPEVNKLSGKSEYSIVALFPKGADLSALKKAAEECLVEKLGADKSKWPKNIRSPFRDQSEREKDGVLPAGHEAGAIFMNYKSKDKPGVVDQKVQPIIDEAEFFPGCWARATVRASYYDQAGNKGVGFYLQNVQKLRDGEPLGGRVAATSEFAPVAGATDASDMWS